MALDDLDDRFAAAVKLALAASRNSGDEEDDASASAECPSADAIASYYEYALSRVERARLEDHFSGCARCQGTLAALLRAAPTLDSVSEAGAFAAAAARRAAAESAGDRERWFEISPAWRIVGVSAAVTAMLAVAVVAGLRVYQSTFGREGEQIAAASLAQPRHHRHRAHPASSPPSDTELALNDNTVDKKSLPRAEPAAPKTAPAPAAAVNPTVAADKTNGRIAGGGVAETTPQSTAQQSPNTAAAGEAPEEETLPPAPPTGNNRNGAGPESAAQAAAALGALAVTPAPPAAASAASAPAAVPPATPPTSAVANATAGKDVAAIAAGAIAAAGAAAIVADKASSTLASKVAAKAAAQTAAAGSPAPSAGEAVNGVNTPALQTGQLAAKQLTQDQLAQQAKTQLAEAQQTLEVARQEEAARKAEAVRQAEAARKADPARRADLARKAVQAKREADLRRRMDEAQAKSALASSAPATEVPPQSTAMLRAELPSSQPRPQPEIGNAGAGNEIAMAERPAVIAPATVRIAPGIPVAPHAVLVSPADHSVFWSLQSDGVIYGTHDRKSWSPQYTGVQAELLAGMAPSNTVCWAVGRKGVILQTTDGTHWTQISSPTTSDVIGITAASKDVATIFTANGTSYSTFDGGSNWQKVN